MGGRVGASVAFGCVCVWVGGLGAHIAGIVRRLLGDEEDALELDLTLGGEVSVRERLAEVFRERLVE